MIYLTDLRSWRNVYRVQTMFVWFAGGSFRCSSALCLLYLLSTHLNYAYIRLIPYFLFSLLFSSSFWSFFSCFVPAPFFFNVIASCFIRYDCEEKSIVLDCLMINISKHYLFSNVLCIEESSTSLLYSETPVPLSIFLNIEDKGTICMHKILTCKTLIFVLFQGPSGMRKIWVMALNLPDIFYWLFLTF